MASVQSRILEFGIRRMNLFGGEKIDPLSLRHRIDRWASIARPHRHVQRIPVQAGSVPAEWLVPQGSPTDRALLYLHGGAWFMGSPATHRAFVSRLAYLSHTRALSIDYRLAPEHPFPAGLQDCLEAYRWLQQNGIPAENIIVAGDSAGGNLALAMLIALQERREPLPAGAVALSPVTDLTNSGKSHQSKAHLDPFFADMKSNRFIEDYLAGHDPHEPLISPLFADLSGLPPLLIHVGEHEILLDDAVRFGEKALSAAVEATTVVWPGMFHVFHVAGSLLPEARRANEQIANFIRSSLDHPRP